MVDKEALKETAGYGLILLGGIIFLTVGIGQLLVRLNIITKIIIAIIIFIMILYLVYIRVKYERNRH